jgi:DNA-binding protein Fis
MTKTESETRAEVLREAIEAARGEYLEDATGTPEDEAYDQAVSDVVAAIGALLEGGR